MALHGWSMCACLCVYVGLPCLPPALWAVLNEAPLTRHHFQSAGVQAKIDTRNPLVCVCACVGNRQMPGRDNTYVLPGRCHYAVLCAVLCSRSCIMTNGALVCSWSALCVVWVLFCTGLETGPCSVVGKAAAGWRWFGWLGLPVLLLESGSGGSRCVTCHMQREWVCSLTLHPPITIRYYQARTVSETQPPKHRLAAVQLS